MQRGTAPNSPAPFILPETAGGDSDAPDKQGPRVAVIVGAVLVAAALLVLLTLGATFLLSRLELPFGGSSETVDYQVGDCVIQAGNAAEPADCGNPEAYLIVSQVNDREECADPTQPAIEVAGPPVQFFCLVPATQGDAAEGDGDSEDTEGSDGSDGGAEDTEDQGDGG
jgi:hypothetical protein